MQGTSFVWRLMIAALCVACGGPAKLAEPCSAIESVRRQIYDLERHNLDAGDWTAQRPPEQKHKAAGAIVSEIVTTCTAGRWSKQVVDCLVAAVSGPAAGPAPSQCKNKSTDALVTRGVEDAEERVLTQLFGPRPRDALDDFADKWERWEQRKASPVEPRVTIPSRYVGLAWFSRKAGQMFQLLASMPSPPACLDGVLSAVEGYYQAEPLGGEPSLLAVLGMLDRDQTEACFQEAATRLVPGTRLERDGALTQLITSTGRTVGYTGWASDGAVYWNPDRAVVADAVAQRTTITSNADVMALVARVDRKKSAWIVLAADATSKLLGVPSTGMRFATDMFGSGHKFTAETAPRIAVTLEFATPRDVTRVVAALRAPHPALSPALAAQLAKLAPIANGNELELDIAPIFSRPELYDELRAALVRIGK